ncbi:MAG: response regulator [Fimbriimonadales bacterium]
MLGLNILVVEDEQSLDRVIGDAFRLIGLPAETARSGHEALERLQNRTYDLVILDVRLPDRPGSEVLREIRASAPDTAVIVMTAYAGGEELEGALQHGVDALLFKPFEIDTLLSSARHLLVSRARQSSRTLPAFAVVQMETPPPSVSRPKERLLLHPNDLITLQGLSSPLMGRVSGRDDHLLCVQTPPYAEVPPKRLQVEWAGNDALYRFRAVVAEHTPTQEHSLWVLNQPRLIQRLQRRKYPRLSAAGQVFISDETRLRRTFEGSLVDLSEEGLAVEVPYEPRRGTQVALQGTWEQHPFQVEAEVRYVVASNRERKPVYRLGLRTAQFPSALREALQQAHRKQLLEHASS